MKPLLLALSLLLALALPAAAMDFRQDGRTLYVTGRIDAGDAATFTKLLNGINTVVVDSQGGLVGEAADMADAIQSRQLTVLVPQRCHSACVLIFAAAPVRLVVPGAEIGVHGARSPDGKESTGGTIWSARRLIQLGAPAAVVAKLVATPPDDLALLTDNDLTQFGARFVRR